MFTENVFKAGSKVARSSPAAHQCRPGVSSFVFSINTLLFFEFTSIT